MPLPIIYSDLTVKYLETGYVYLADLRNMSIITATQFSLIANYGAHLENWLGNYKCVVHDSFDTQFDLVIPSSIIHLV